MRRTTALAVAVTLASALPTLALAQRYAAEPPASYMAAPPSAWGHEDFWRHMDAHRRQEYFAQYRHEHWRCDHGDRDACHWLHVHERG